MPKTEVSLKPSVETLEQRLDSMDRAIVLLQDSVNRMPTPAIVMEKVHALESLHDEKFRGIATQFKERDTRTEQSASSTKIAVDAALQAAKEAVAAQNTASAQAIAKSEAATTKQIDAIANLITAQAKGTDEKIDDVKGRIQSLESQKAGAQEQRSSNKDAFGYVIGAVGIVIAVATFIVTRT